MKRNKLRIIAAAAAVLIILISSCGTPELSAPEKPTASAPDPDNPNRIELSWKAVDKADIYYVYRSTSENGTYELEGHSVTSEEVELSSGTTELRYSFLDVFEAGDGGTYWYGVTAARNSDITASGQSAMSPVVGASTYSGTWGARKDLDAAVQLKLAADNTNLWAVYSAGGPGAAVNVQKYAADPADESDEPAKIWTPVTTPMTTAGGVNNPFSIFISGGELHTVFSDASAADTNFVSMQYYHDSGTAEAPVFAWEQVGAAKFNTSSAGAVTEVSAVTLGFAGDIYSAFLEGTAGQLYKNNDVITLGLSNVEDIRIVVHNNTLYYGYESGGNYYLREYDAAFESLEPEAGTEVVSSAVDDGNIDFVSGGGDLYAVYIVDTTGVFNVLKLVDGTWTALTNSTGKPVTAAGDFGTLDVLWFNGYLYVFYIDASDRGWVKFYDEDDGWQNAQVNGGTEITGSGVVSRVQLVSAGNTLYAGYIEGTNAYVRILE